MARAKLTLGDNGEINVTVISWAQPTIIYSVSREEMELVFEEATEDGQAEPDYDIVSDMVYESLDGYFNPKSFFNQSDLRKCVKTIIHPGGAHLETLCAKHEAGGCYEGCEHAYAYGLTFDI